ncbi:MAG: transcription-repair coupling factor [Verrucomicrobiae bacterium]|nr:transcription-repair coupling factor [Verrucomicrobiae bacterium]
MPEISILEEMFQFDGIRGLPGKLEKGCVLSLHGVADAARPFLAAVLGMGVRGVLCVLARSVRQQEHYASELSALRAWLPADVGLLCVPEREPGLDANHAPDLEILAEVLNSLAELQKRGGRRLVISTMAAFEQPLPAQNELLEAVWILKEGENAGMEAALERLVKLGYENQGGTRPGEAGMVTGRGQFARRGGILDVFSFQGEAPVRLEFNGDAVESIRVFDLARQTSIENVKETILMGLDVSRFREGKATLRDYLGENYFEWREAEGEGGAVEICRAGADGKGEMERVELGICSHDFLANPSFDAVLQEQRRELLLRHWRDWLAEGWRVAVFCNNEGEERRLQEVLGADAVCPQMTWLRGALLRGFCWPDARLAVLTDAEIFGRYQTQGMIRLQRRLARARLQRDPIDFSEFEEGDLVVHVQQGIGRFLGIRKVEEQGAQREALALEYAGGALLYVPIEQAHLVGRYVGVGKRSADLDELGGGKWDKTRRKAEQAVMDYAAKLLGIQAERQHENGFAFAPDTAWQKEMEDSFLYDETPDQLTAIEEVKQDMETPKPMDRLICGDVGFGKTEVAMRAVFKAVMNGRQAAVLAPTTVLAQQHERTFKERMADYPIRIESLTRFRTRKEQRQVLQALREGGVDVVIGTHRLLQPDVVFKNLGLVVVDEEQRFGVEHKERFKERFHLIDMLTLSATPIPRTLYLALVAARDMSQIETPPPNRLPVETQVVPYDERVIRGAIERELARGGQVFFLHNRVQSIQRVADRIKELLPSARVAAGHGQMEDDELEEIMSRFVEGKVDVLVSTTIVESGLDIPRANTIIIDRADRFGLADLYQLRGRVGRSQMKAYAYLLLPRHLMMEAHARKRVSAIKQYSQLGAGFKVAMRDLEIRGAGNLLGTAQSGHACAIGFELYCQLLRETVARIKGEKTPPRIEVKVRLDFLELSEDLAGGGAGAFVPKAYMTENRQRIDAYRKLAETADEAQLTALVNEWRDRFGRLPAPVERLHQLGRIRLAAAAAGVQAVEVEEGKLLLQRGGGLITVGGRLPRLSSENVDARLMEILRLIRSLAPKTSG